MDIGIQYNGEFPNLCSGQLIVTIDGREWEFPTYCLVSGGSVYFDDEWSDHIKEGDWSIDDWPDGFPEELKSAVLEAVNDHIPHGCCGGCG